MNESEMSQAFRDFTLKQNTLPKLYETMIQLAEMQKLYETAYEEGFNMGFEAAKKEYAKAP